MILQVSPSWLGVTLSDWADIGTVAAAGIGIITAVIAAVAIIQARRLQTAASEPYVAVMLEPNVHFRELAELVIKNYGSTAAHGIEVVFTPAAVRVDRGGPGKTKPLKVPSPIPTLVPGQEWRTTWDMGKEHKRSKLPDQYSVTVTYKGLRWRKHRDQFTLDWAALMDHTYLEVKTIHHVAKRLEELHTTVKKGIPIAAPVGVQWSRKPNRVDAWWARRREEKYVERMRKEMPEYFPTPDGDA